VATAETEPVVFTRNGCVTLTKKVNGKTVHSPGSNFWIAPDGWHVEGDFQWEKHVGHPWRQVIIDKCAPGMAKSLGREFKLNREELIAWDRRKWSVMWGLLQQKLYYPEFVLWLMSTQEQKIVEINWWHDNYWGDCQCIKCFRQGSNNHLGQQLMRIREQIQKGEIKVNAEVAA
jgi:predicted NAD-dependent protein-ADP-ribosyltransferase YbiA (DUF1768 family)